MTSTLVRKHVSINSILFDNKHHYRNFNRSLKILIDSCTELNVDSAVVLEVGVQAHSQRFDLVKIQANSLKVQTKYRQNL